MNEGLREQLAVLISGRYTILTHLVMLCVWLALYCIVQWYVQVQSLEKKNRTKSSFVEYASLGGFVPAMVFWQVR